MSFKIFLESKISGVLSFIYLVLFFALLSCATQPTIDLSNKKNKSEIEPKILQTLDHARVDEASIRKKMHAFERALSKGSLSENDLKLHDELLNEYVRLKQQASTKIIVPPRTKLTLPLETYCLESRKAGPVEKEIYHWQKSSPSISYYKEILKLRRAGEITQQDVQELVWNLANKTNWDEYPVRLRAILQKIDSQAALKLPSKLKNQATDSLMNMASGLTGVDTAIDLYRLAEGKFHQFQDFAAQIESLSSKHELSNHDDLTKIPNTELYTQSLSNGYSDQTLTLYNPTDAEQEIDLEDFYLAPEREDVQRVGINSNTQSGLLGDLEKLLFEAMLRAGVGFTPVLNDVADLYELFSGIDFITGEALSPLERSLSGLGLLAGSGSGYRYAKRMIHAPEKYSPRFVEGIEKLSRKPIAQVSTQAAEESLQKVRNRPHQSRSAEEVNRLHQSKGNMPPYKAKTKVVEFESLEGEKWVRLHGASNQEGSWVIRKEAIKDLNSQQLQKKYSLPRAPSEISDVTLPKGVKIRRGRVAENFGGNSGAVQYEILVNRPHSDWFSGRRPLP